MIAFHKYPEYYPNLISEMLIFFCKYTTKGNVSSHTPQKIRDFCLDYYEKNKHLEYPDPNQIGKICDVLVEHNVLHQSLKGQGPVGENMYSYMPTEKENIDKMKFGIFQYLINLNYNSLIFGFKFINNYASNKVNPILFIDFNGDQSIGSSFNYKNGIATAKHCIDGAKKIAIKNISKEVLRKSQFLVHYSNDMDLIFIDLADNKTFQLNETFLWSTIGEVLDEVLALGFPKTPGFHTFLTSETARISSRYTGTIGSISAIAEDFWMKKNLMLVTAKIRAGNSGGPIINSTGRIVGVSSNIPTAKGDYDDLGYGTVIPVEFLDEIVDKKRFKIFDTSNIEFIDFPNE